MKINHAKLLCHDGSVDFAKAKIAKLEAARRAREDLSSRSASTWSTRSTR